LNVADFVIIITFSPFQCYNLMSRIFRAEPLRNSSTVAQRLMDNRDFAPFGCGRVLKPRGSALLWSLFENKSSLTNGAIIGPHRIARPVARNLLSAREQATYQVAFRHRHCEPRALLVDFLEINFTLANSILDPRTLHASVLQMWRHLQCPRSHRTTYWFNFTTSPTRPGAPHDAARRLHFLPRFKTFDLRPFMFGSAQIWGWNFPKFTKHNACQNQGKDRYGAAISDAEEHEPDHAEDQDREAGGDKQESKYRRPRLSLPRFGWRFDDLALVLCCHGGLDFFDGAPSRSAQGVGATHDFGRCSGF
jgi:hypothetical protein